jgi:hypothetical protein
MIVPNLPYKIKKRRQLLPTNKKTILRQNDKVAHVIRAIAAWDQGSGR